MAHTLDVGNCVPGEDTPLPAKADTPKCPDAGDCNVAAAPTFVEPPPPPAEAQGSDKYYFYGWPVTAATLERLLTKYEPPPGSTHYLQTVIMLSRGLQAASTFRPIYCTFIQPHEEDGPLPTLRRPLPGLSFFMISASEDAGGQPFSSRRATREQMDKLVEI
ncbi:hypothetical protein EV714DRAFT_189464, partial [Schizophyllum commune]